MPLIMLMVKEICVQLRKLFSRFLVGTLLKEPYNVEPKNVYDVYENMLGSYSALDPKCVHTSPK